MAHNKFGGNMNGRYLDQLKKDIESAGYSSIFDYGINGIRD